MDLLAVLCTCFNVKTLDGGCVTSSFAQFAGGSSVCAGAALLWRHPSAKLLQWTNDSSRSLFNAPATTIRLKD